MMNSQLPYSELEKREFRNKFLLDNYTSFKFF